MFLTNHNSFALSYNGNDTASSQKSKLPSNNSENNPNGDELFEKYRIEQLSRQLEYEKLNSSKFEKEIQEKNIRIYGLQETQRNIHFNYLLAFIGFTIITGALLFLFLKHNRKRVKEICLTERLAFEKELARAKANQSLETIESERERISRNLHDGISNNLVSLRLHLQSVNSALPQKELLLGIVDNTHREIRAIMHNLGTPAIENVLFEQLFYNHFEIMNFKDSFRVYGVLIPDSGWETIEKRLQTELYRLLQEITGNIVKHSGATDVNITLRRDENEIVLIAEDNGVGIKASQNSLGLGFKNLKVRIDHLQGFLQVDSAPMQGTVIRATIPLLQQ